MTRLRDIYGPGYTQAEYLAALQAGNETGCWDDHGVPCPWPDNYDDTDPDWTDDPYPVTQQNGDEPPF